MSIARKHFGIIKNGRAVFNNIPLLEKEFTALEGKEFEATFREKKEFASEAQYKFYRGYVLPTLAEACGVDTDTMHKDMLSRMNWTTSSGKSKKELSALIQEALNVGRDNFNINWMSPGDVDYGE